MSNPDNLKAYFVKSYRPMLANKALAASSYSFKKPNCVDSCIYEMSLLGYDDTQIKHVQNLLKTQKPSVKVVKLLCTQSIPELIIPVFEAGKTRLEDDINLPNTVKGFTFLHEIAQHNNLEILKHFQKPFDLNKQDDNGNTALHIAITEGHFEIATYLIQHGASISILNKAQLSAEEFLTFTAKVIKNVHSINQICNDNSEASFDKAIQDFLLQHNLKSLAELFPKNSNAKLRFLQKAFWSLDAIDYLTHKQQIYEIPEGNPKIPNANETELYCLLKENLEFYIPYRANLKEFLKDGTPKCTSEYLLKLVNERHPEINKGPLYLFRPGDIYEQTSNVAWLCAVGKLKGDKNGFAYILTACPKDAHIYPMLSIVNVETKQPIAQYFLNSWDKEEYYNYTDYRIGLRFEEDNLYERTPLFNLSFHVQTHEKDANCGLYTNAILESIIQVWEKTPEIFENLAKHATGILQQKQKVDYNYKTPLFEGFTTEIKKNLPQFFDDQLNPKKFEDLRHHFLQQRWNIGRSVLRENQRKSVQHLNSVIQLLHAHRPNLEVQPLTVPAPLPIAASSDTLEYTVTQKKQTSDSKNTPWLKKWNPLLGLLGGTILSMVSILLWKNVTSIIALSISTWLIALPLGAAAGLLIARSLNNLSPSQEPAQEREIKALTPQKNCATNSQTSKNVLHLYQSTARMNKTQAASTLVRENTPASKNAP